MSVTRKDYGANAIVADGNPVIRRINAINAPHSVQAVGGAVLPKDRIMEDYDDIVVGTRVLAGNVEFVVKTVNKTNDVVDDVVLSRRDLSDQEVTVALTKAQLEADNNFIVIKDLAGIVVVIDSVEVLPATSSLAAEETEQLTVTATDEDTNDYDVTTSCVYESDDEAVATVDSEGLITAVSSGSATITATYDGSDDTCVVTVS